MEVVHLMYISRFKEKNAQLAWQKQVILIGGASRGLITLKGVLVFSSCFYFTLRTMFNSSLGGEFKNSILFSKTQLLYLLTCFSYLFSVIWLLFVCAFLYFVCFVSHMFGLVPSNAFESALVFFFIFLVKNWDTFAFA